MEHNQKLIDDGGKCTCDDFTEENQDISRKLGRDVSATEPSLLFRLITVVVPVGILYVVGLYLTIKG